MEQVILECDKLNKSFWNVPNERNQFGIWQIEQIIPVMPFRVIDSGKAEVLAVMAIDLLLPFWLAE